MKKILERKVPPDSVKGSSLSRRAYSEATTASSWKEIWEAGPYFDRISSLLEEAEEYAIFVGWQIDSRLLLKNPRTSILEPLKEKVIRLCEEKPNFRVYFLLWDHAYFYVLERETWQGRIWEDVHPQVHFVFDNRHCMGGSHHEKVAIIDGKIALCGGIDLCDGRWDSPQHLYFDKFRSLSRTQETHGPYHDLAVQVTGPVCEGIHNHIERRWKALSSIPFPSSPVCSLSSSLSSSGRHRVYISRTIAELDRASGGIALVREIEFLYRDLISLSRKRIILEGQYYWSRILNNLLIKKIRKMRGTDFEIYIILSDLRCVKSLSKRMMSYEFGLLNKLNEAARSSGVKLVIGFPSVLPPLYVPVDFSLLASIPDNFRFPPKPIYVHSKVIVVDDRFLGIGSANLASRALRIDTEIQLTLESWDESERTHISCVGDFIISHWKLNDQLNGQLMGSSGQFGICSKVFQSGSGPVNFEKNLGNNPNMTHRSSWVSKVSKMIPWEIFFDPELPWFYRVKKKYWGFLRRRLYSVVYSLFLIWLFGVFFAWLVAGVSWGESRWPVYYLAILSSVWLFPIPFTLIQMLAVFDLGYPQAIKLVVSALWVASVIGYWVARCFPAYSSRYYSLTGPSWLPERLGLRSFPVLLSVLFDPRVSIHSKIAYQGIYCIPMPWFVLGTGIVLPAFLYMAARLEAYVLTRIIPNLLGIVLRQQMGSLLWGLFMFSCFKLGVRLWRKKG